MTGASALAGHNGQVSIANPFDSGTEILIARITQWSINPTSSETAWGDSDSGGYTNRKAARFDCTGTITAKFENANSNKRPYDYLKKGDIVKLVLWEDNAADGGTNQPWVFPSALIQSFNQTVDVDTKEVIEWSADFGADGIFHEPDVSAGLFTGSPALP